MKTNKIVIGQIVNCRIQNKKGEWNLEIWIIHHFNLEQQKLYICFTNGEAIFNSHNSNKEIINFRLLCEAIQYGVAFYIPFSSYCIDGVIIKRD